MKPTVLIADDHQMFREGIRNLLAPHYEIVGEAGDGETLIGLAMEHLPDVIVSDLSMPGMSGLQVIRGLKEKGITAKVVLLTMHAEPEYAAEAMEAGASGFVLKSSASSVLLGAINEALTGGVYLPAHLARDIFEISTRSPAPPELTERHRDILRLLAQGLVAKEIGDQLSISPRTVEYHKYHLMEKLGLKTTAELIHYAVKKKIVDVS